MPVTTRLQARMAFEVSASVSKALSNTPLPSPPPPPPPPPQFSSPSKTILPKPSPATSSSAPHLAPITCSFATVHARRQLSHILHHFQGDITKSSPYFPRLSPIYVPKPYVADERTKPEYGDLSEYVADDDYNYDYDYGLNYDYMVVPLCPTCTSASPKKPPSEESSLFISPSSDTGEELRSVNRWRLEHTTSPDMQFFQDNLQFAVPSTPRMYINTSPRSSSSSSLPELEAENPSRPSSSPAERSSLGYR